VRRNARSRTIAKIIWYSLTPQIPKLIQPQRFPLHPGLEQNTVLGILRLHGHWVQGSAPAASREGVTKIPDELNRYGSPTHLARRPLVAHNILSP